uniref:Helix-hairpin-helix domain-containing protein n=1 Tax=Chlorobium chlorochromatii (strain CaD3) TaxID=340177 RepID=Q3AT59_CHLCH
MQLPCIVPSTLRRYLPTLFVTSLALLPLTPISVYGEMAEDLAALSSSSESDYNSEVALALLEELRHHPLSINRATANELRQLPWLSAADVHAIIKYRTQKGAFRSLSELETILGKERATWLSPYLTVEAAPVPAKTTVRPKATSTSKKTKKVATTGSLYSRYFTEMPPRKGILTEKYEGGNSKMYHRAQFYAPHVSASVVQEKDIGEAAITDFTSLSVSVADVGMMERVVLGNYRLTLGQGLMIGQGRFFSKGAEVGGRLTTKTLMPYASASEEGFLQGAAATLQIQPIALTLFYSANQRDAIINKEGVITSLSSSGYHRTTLEVSRKDNITENVMGAHLRYRTAVAGMEATLGGGMMNYSYPYPFDELEPNEPVSTVLGATLTNVDATLSFGSGALFAEAAFASDPHDMAWFAGAEYEPLRGVTAVAALRRYGENFYSPFANAFAERGGGSNEEGLYTAVQAAFSKKVTLGAYYDRFTFPQLGSHYQQAADGFDARAWFSWQQSSLLCWNVQVQHKEKPEEKNQGTTKNPIWTPLPILTDRLQLNCEVTPHKGISLRTRFELKNVDKEYLLATQSFTGKMWYQQVGYRTENFSLKGRFTRFTTTDYAAAIYAYEDDLPLTSSLGMYSGDGSSLFAVATWQPMKQMKVAARYEVTRYNDRDVYSSGNDERATNAPSSLHVGCMLSF